MAETLEQKLRERALIVLQAADRESAEPIAALYTEAADALAAISWQPIETAPKDGTNVLLFCPKGDGNLGSTYRVTEGQWLSDPGGTTEYRDIGGRWTGQDDREGFEGWMSWDGGFSEDTMMPTRWQPMPAPPLPTNRETLSASAQGAETLGNLDCVGDSPSAGFEKELSSESEKRTPPEDYNRGQRADWLSGYRAGLADKGADGPCSDEWSRGRRAGRLDRNAPAA